MRVQRSSKMHVPWRGGVTILAPRYEATRGAFKLASAGAAVERSECYPGVVSAQAFRTSPVHSMSCMPACLECTR